MKDRIAIALFLLWSCIMFSQDTATTVSKDSSYKKTDSTITVASKEDNLYVPEKPKTEFVKVPASPTVGLGIGFLSFWGDVNDGKIQSPNVSRLAYDLVVKQPLSDILTLNFNAVYGKLGVNERFTAKNSNVNFESEIRAGSVSIAYNFGNYLSPTRTATPYISIGISGFEYLSKTDLYDKNGNKYYYWSDGSIRNIDQNNPNAANATLLNRDYTYESDVRETNVLKYGKYPERSFAIPLGFGCLFNVNEFIDFRISSTMYFSMTDHIDGLVDNSGALKFLGKHKNDIFTMTSCGLSYSFGYKTIAEDIEAPIKIEISEADFYAMDTDDRDKDGVPDVIDKCQFTPAGVAVDSLGCPFDSDNDGFPDYKDKEVNSPQSAIVDNFGVQLTDSSIAASYRRYNDTTSLKDTPVEGFFDMKIQDIPAEQEIAKEYVISLGTYDKGVPTNLLTKFLSVHDITSISISEKVSMYTAGDFNNLEDAEKRRREIAAIGIPNLKILSKENGKYIEVPQEEIANASISLSSVIDSSKNETLPKGVFTRTVVTSEGIFVEKYTKDTLSASNNVPPPLAVGTSTVAPIVDTKKDSITAVVSAATTTLSSVEKMATNLSVKDTVKPIAAVSTTLSPANNISENLSVKDTTKPITATSATLSPVENKGINTSVKDTIKQAIAVTTKTLTPVINEVSKTISTKLDSLKIESKVASAPLEKAKDTIKKQEVLAVKKDSTSGVKTSIVKVISSEKVADKESLSGKVKPATTNKNMTNAITPSVVERKVLTGSSSKIFDESGTVFRVQLGAYSKPLSKEAFLGIRNLIEIKTQEGLYKYMTGAYSTMEEAAQVRIEMILKGYEGAFITAYKNGERISIKEAGGTMAEPEVKSKEISDTTRYSVASKELVVFKVQVGIYKDIPPPEMRIKFEKMTNVVVEKTVTGLNRYVIGNFKEYVKAEEFRYEIIKKYGVVDPFVVAQFNDEYITVQEALELLR